MHIEIIFLLDPIVYISVCMQIKIGILISLTVKTRRDFWGGALDWTEFNCVHKHNIRWCKKLQVRRRVVCASVFSLIFVNLLGISDSKKFRDKEADFTAIRSIELLQKVDLIPQTFDFERLKAIHRYLFQDVYEWAGKHVHTM